MRLLAVNAAVCAAALALVLGGVELWLRLTVPASSSESIFQYTLDTPRYKVMKPGARVVAWGKELRTNDLGFRDEAATVSAKQPGELRIIVLGASFTVSAGVDYRQIYTTLLQERLKRNHPQVRVINLAVAGYNIVQQAMVLQEVGLRLKPDMVLVSLCPENDFTTDNHERNYRVASGKQPAEPARAWYETLYVHQAYLGRAQARLEKLLSDKSPQAGAAQQESTEEGWDKNVASLKTIADIARREKLPLAVAVLPHLYHFEQQRPVFARIERMCHEHGLGCVTLLEPFIARGIEESTLRLNRIDAHPNEKYNVVVADELLPHVAAALDRLEGRDGLRYAGFPAARPAAAGAK
jgi:hypothetical protein